MIILHLINYFTLTDFRVVLLLGILWLSACGALTSPPLDVTKTPVVETRVLALPTQVPPTVDVTALTSQEVYTHSSQRFSINHPRQWDIIEQADGVVIAEPDANAGYSVVYSDAGEKYSTQELSQFLVTFVAQNYAADASDFKAISQEQQPDGTFVAQFSRLDHNLGQTISEVRVSQQDTILFVVHLSVLADQWEDISPHIQALADSFSALDTSSALVSSTPIPPDWALIGPENKEFGFLYANDWEILTEEDNLISVGSPEHGMTFTVSNFNWPGAATDPQAAEQAALQHLEEVQATYTDVQSLAPVSFPLDTTTGATIDFLYTTDAGQTMAGSVITGVGNGKMHKIVFTAPTDFYDAALQWFNPMYKSFKFLSPDTFISEE